MYLVKKSIEISCSHRLLQYIGKCHNSHGHTYKIEATMKFKDTELQQNGISLDFNELKKHMNELDKRYDHKHLNDEAPFNKAKEVDTENLFDEAFKDTTCDFDLKYDENTKHYNSTAENMARIFFNILKENVPSLYSVTIWETPTSSVTYIPTDEDEKVSK